MIRAELARLLTVRGTYGAALAAIALGVLLAVSGLAPANDIREMSVLAAYPAAIAGFACAHLLGEEFVSGALSPTFVVQPRRTAVLAAKALAAAVYGLVVGVLVTAAMLITAALWLAHFDIAFEQDVLGFVTAGALVTASFAVAGTGAAVLTRRPGVATGLLAAVYLVGSGLLGRSDALGFWNEHGIGAVMFAVLEDGPAPQTVALNAAYALVLLSVGVLAARRADL
jgi:ABC-2 type transport system permease protein